MDVQEYAKALAPFLKERENHTILGIMIGQVLSISPYKIKVDDKIMIEQEDLIFSSSLLKGYQRDFTVENIKGDTNSVNDGGQGATAHSHTLTDLSGNIQYTVDLLEVDDEVIVIPNQTLSTWYVMDKAGRLS